MSTYITKMNGHKESMSLDMTLDQTGIYGLYLLDDPANLRTLRTPAENCVCAFNYISRIVSIVQGCGYNNNLLAISDVREEETK